MRGHFKRNGVRFSVESDEPEFGDIVEVIERDVSFSYEILRIANTAYYYRGSKVTSVRQAAIKLGINELKKWAYITVLRKMGGENYDPIINISVQRAKSLELLSQKTGLGERNMELFTIGILSMIDILSGVSMEMLLEELPLTNEAKQILLGDFDEDKMSVCFKLILAYEKGEWEQVFALTDRHGISVEDVAESYHEAVIWMDQADMN